VEYPAGIRKYGKGRCPETRGTLAFEGQAEPSSSPACFPASRSRGRIFAADKIVLPAGIINPSATKCGGGGRGRAWRKTEGGTRNSRARIRPPCFGGSPQDGDASSPVAGSASTPARAKGESANRGGSGVRELSATQRRHFRPPPPNRRRSGRSLCHALSLSPIRVRRNRGRHAVYADAQLRDDRAMQMPQTARPPRLPRRDDRGTDGRTDTGDRG
jgi:hypothetical protein